MLHHIAASENQDLVLSELHRVLRQGGVLVAADGIYNEDSKALHEGDIYNPIDPDDLEHRLAYTGFSEIEVRRYEFGWVATAVR
jgi:SAM-dependent methyltransferase